VNGSRIPQWLIVVGAVGAAIPFGWGVGVAAAYAIAGQDIGQLPAATVPIGILASMVFAIWPTVKAKMRFQILSLGALAFILLAWLLG